MTSKALDLDLWDRWNEIQLSHPTVKHTEESYIEDFLVWRHGVLTPGSTLIVIYARQDQED